MPDLFTLRMLSNSITILEKSYTVVWNTVDQKAQIMYSHVEAETDGIICFVEDDEGNIRQWDSELEAHDYLTNLRTLHNTGDPDAWRKIVEE